MKHTQAPGRKTVDIEADETCFKSWSESKEDPETGENTTMFYWYVWFGFKERGTVSKLWLKPMGIRCSHNAPTVPLTRESYLKVLEEAGFCAETRAVMMTDSALVFVNTGHVGVQDAHQVNHSVHEFARSVEVIYSTSSCEWSSIQHHLVSGHLFNIILRVVIYSTSSCEWSSIQHHLVSHLFNIIL